LSHMGAMRQGYTTQCAAVLAKGQGVAITKAREC
jgi:hypothetical protein